jgi:cytoskeletal protein RodZ
MANSPRQEDRSLNLDASNAHPYERRQRERREQSQDEHMVAPEDNKRRSKRVDREVWWVVATFIMMGVAFVAILLVK